MLPLEFMTAGALLNRALLGGNVKRATPKPPPPKLTRPLAKAAPEVLDSTLLALGLQYGVTPDGEADYISQVLRLVDDEATLLTAIV